MHFNPMKLQQPSMCAVGKEGWSHANPPYTGGGGGIGASIGAGGKMTTQHHLQQQPQSQQQQRPAPYSMPPSRYGGSPGGYPHYQQHYPPPPQAAPHPYHQHQQQQSDSEDCHSSRLNFCVPSGTLLGPFRVDHGLAVFRQQFELKPDVYKTLMSRADLELQFMACLVDAPGSSCNWPPGLTVSVNGAPVAITHQCRPVHLKHLLLHPGPGQSNQLQMGLSACCCSHMFLLQLVHRPTVASIFQGLWRKRRLALDSCVEKLRRIQQQQQQQQCVLMLRCPISGRRIDLPARGSDCHHAQCFDLRTYLELNAETNAWRCPVCHKAALLWGLEIDEFIFGLLEETRSCPADRLLLDRDCKWRPILQQQQQQLVDARSASPAGVKPSVPVASQSAAKQQQQQFTPLANGVGMGYGAQAYPTSVAAPAYPQGAQQQPIYPTAVTTRPAYNPTYQQQQQQQPPQPNQQHQYPPWSYQHNPQQQQQPMQHAQSQQLQQQTQPQQQQQQQYSSSYPPTNSTNASSCSTTDPASIKTDLDDLALEPLGDAGAIGDLLSLLEDNPTADSLLGGIDM